MTRSRNPDSPNPDSLAVERSIVELQRGREMVLLEERHSRAMTLVETLTPALFDIIVSSGPVELVLSPGRAGAMGHPCHQAVAVLPITPDMTLDTVRELAGLQSGPSCLPGAHQWPVPDQPFAAAALQLSRHAQALPATLLYSKPVGPGSILSARVQDALDYRRDTGALMMLSRTRIPLAGANSVELCVFRERHGLAEHVAIVVGHPDLADVTRVRIHSSCFTGDILGSLRCDCGEQLNSAIEAMAEDDGGVILYLSQEGRGIGLSNKLRAYQLQDEGLDTLEANQHLGFGEDERRYHAAATMLDALGLRRIRLLTNNPLKIEALRQQGFDVVERLPSHTCANPHNVRYLETKRVRAGHMLGVETIA